MTDTPEVKEQVEQQEEEIKEFVPPKCAKRVYHTRANPTVEELYEDDNLPSINLICTKEYLNVNRIADWNHFTDENWHEWKERMKWVFFNCDITGYVTGNIKCPNEVINPIGTHNWDKNDIWAQQIIICNVTSLQMNHVRSKSSAEQMFSKYTVW